LAKKGEQKGPDAFKHGGTKGHRTVEGALTKGGQPTSAGALKKGHSGAAPRNMVKKKTRGHSTP